MKPLRFHLIFVVAAMVILAPASASAGSIKVIANSSVKADSVSADELKSVFLEETSSLSDGSHVEPVLAKGGAAHETFVKEYLGKSDAALQTYYRSLVFTGKGSMPRTVGGDAEVAAYVAKTRGAIGYVGAETSTEGVKTLQVK
jgi:ABC-type phosphate transport system substrate-binding protein